MKYIYILFAVVLAFTVFAAEFHLPLNDNHLIVDATGHIQTTTTTTTTTTYPYDRLATSVAASPDLSGDFTNGVAYAGTNAYYNLDGTVKILYAAPSWYIQRISDLIGGDIDISKPYFQNIGTESTGNYLSDGFSGSSGAIIVTDP